MRVVTAYRPFAPESGAHLALGPFDWPAAIEMLRVSVRQACHCETTLITDLTTPAIGPTLRYATRSTRLMLWLLEIAACYLESPAFDQDTIWISPDTLVYDDLAPWWAADLGLLIRPEPKYRAKPLLNGVQWWRVQGQPRLAACYRQALALAAASDERLIRWGADTSALVDRLGPLHPGPFQVGDLSVYGVSHQALRGAVQDFKGRRKHRMAEVFAARYAAVPC